MSDQNPPVPYSFEVLRPVEVFVVPRRRRRYWLHALLLLVTAFTTLVVGARLDFNFQHNLPAFAMDGTGLSWFPLSWIQHDPANLLRGIPFAATLLAILLVHEMGHFLYCVRYGVYATLPFFIPAPTLIGTLGAFIRIKSPIRSRSALFDIGIAGPVAGFVAATAVLVYALTLSKPMPAGPADTDLVFGYPLIFHVAHALLTKLGISGIGALPLTSANLHPTAVAAWVGMFATALNLLPGGQLDGGHIVYSLWPRAHKWISRLSVGTLIPMGLLLWNGWLVWAVLLAFSGMRHPQVPAWPPITNGRRVLALLAAIMLLLTFVPAPFSGPALSWGN